MTGPRSLDQTDEPDMPFVYLNINDTLSRLTDKHTSTIKYVYENHMNDFDWFLYANDDTYIIMENLKSFLADKCPSEKKLYGKVMIHDKNTQEVYTSGNNSLGYIQGGSGWLSSRESIRLFAEAMKSDSKFCVCRNGNFEDQEVSDCFRKLNIYPGESRDDENRERFLMNKFEEYKNNFIFSLFKISG
jgi:glycoprotein-N-acetylgalactosamine 3-beta-galactosyltransferase